MCSPRREGVPLSAGESEHIEVAGRHVAILFPRDRDCALSPVRRSLTARGMGLSRRQLLDFIHSFYQVHCFHLSVVALKAAGSDL